MSFSVDVSDVRAVESGNLRDDALESLTRQIEADMRPYVKHLTGALERSAEVASDFRGGRITYTATDRRGHEYASDAYNDPNVGRHAGQNPKATAEWGRKAEQDLGASWAQYAGELIEGAVNGSS